LRIQSSSYPPGRRGSGVSNLDAQAAAEAAQASVRHVRPLTPGSGRAEKAAHASRLAPSRSASDNPGITRKSHSAESDPMSAAASEDRERLLRQRRSLQDVIESISSELELRPLLTRLVHHACELLEADDGTIGLWDAERQVVRTEAVCRMPEGELGSEMPPGVGLAGQVLLTRRPVVVERYADLPRPTQSALGHHAVVGVPILRRGELTGVFGIGARPPRRFEQADVELLELLARHAAVAIENARLYSRERQRSERLALIARIGQIATSGLDLDELLQRAADAIHELLDYPNVDIPLIDTADPQTLVIRARGGSYKHRITWEDRLPISTGIMGAAVRERRLQLVNDVRADPRYVTPPAGDVRSRAELAVPILLGDQALGVLNVESDRTFDQEDAASLQIVADSLAVAVRNARLFESAQRVAVLEERQRLSRDLHDSVTQHLFSLTLLSQSLAPTWRRSLAEGEQLTQRVLELTRAGLAEMRALLAELRPSEPVPELERAEMALSGLASLRRDGLAVALQRHAAHLAGLGPPVAMDVDPRVELPFERAEVLYRIAQEALNNAVKHARARRVTVRLRADAENARLEVSDDGVGFTVPSALDPALRATGMGGLGLVGMRERAESIGARLRLRSAPGEGTTIEVVVPIEERI
jgi:signal transduction histidine kinase